MTSLSVLLAARGPAHALSLGLRGRFFAVADGVFFDRHPTDPPAAAARCLEAMAQTYEDEGGQDVDRRAPHLLTFHVRGPAFPGGDPDPWDPEWIAREERLRRARVLWRARYGAPPAVDDAKRTGGIARERAKRYDAGVAVEGERGEEEVEHG